MSEKKQMSYQIVFYTQKIYFYKQGPREVEVISIEISEIQKNWKWDHVWLTHRSISQLLWCPSRERNFCHVDIKCISIVSSPEPCRGVEANCFLIDAPTMPQSRLTSKGLPDGAQDNKYDTHTICLNIYNL